MRSIQKTYLTKCHPDFHLPAHVAVGEGFDASDYVRKVKQAGIDYLVFFGKCHYGFSYYPTKIGTVHPGLRCDMLGEIVKACKKEDIGIAAYYSVFLDTSAAARHPEWRLQAESREIDGGFNSENFTPICVNSDYGDQLLLPQALEILERYEVQEIFFDTMTGFTPCYCKRCREMFGKPIPENAQDPNWLEYVAWYNNRYEQFFAKVLQRIYQVKPEVAVTFNWQWSARLPSQPSPHTKRLAGDLFPSGAVSSYYSRYWAGAGLPFDYMCGRFMHGLGEWSNNTPETLKYTAAGAIANGGSFYLIDRQLPNGDLEERAWPLLKEVFAFVNERRNAVTDTRHVPETAVLFSYAHIVGRRLEYFPDLKVRQQRQRPMLAISNILRNHGRHYTALNLENLLLRLDEYRLVILPETDFLEQSTVERLSQYVERGGKLLVIQSETPPETDVLKLAGVEFSKYTQLDYGYIACETAGISEPVMIRSRMPLVKTMPGTKTLKAYVSPLSEGQNSGNFGHGYAPPTHSSGYAAVACRELGHGEIIYVSAPVLTSFDDYFNPHIAGLVLELMDRLLPAPLVRVKTRAQVEMSAVRQMDDLIIHLVNHSGHEVLAGYWCPVVEYIPEVPDVQVAVKADERPLEVVEEKNGHTIPAESREGYLNFTVPALGIMESFRLKGYFCP